MKPLITLTTDFGYSEYVGAMKGVIFSLCPEARVIDISHSIRKFDIRHAVYVVHTVCSRFPKGTIHMVVVDPGVGTERKGIIVQSENYLFVGPDNGTFSLVQGTNKIYELKLKRGSKTFHGRDIFAPAAAMLASGISPLELGREIAQMERIEYRNVIVTRNTVSGEVMCHDYFGNIITNIRGREILKMKVKYDDILRLCIGGGIHEARFVETYGVGEDGELVGLIGSGNYLEFAVNKGDASARLGLMSGGPIEVEVRK